MFLHAQEKELQHLRRSLAALSDEPQPDRQGSQSHPHTKLQASLPQQGSWLPAVHEHAQPQNAKHIRDLWSDDELLPNNTVSNNNKQKASTGISDSRKQPTTQVSLSCMAQINEATGPPLGAVKSRKPASDITFQQRSADPGSGDRPETPQKQPYIVTEPESPASQPGASAQEPYHGCQSACDAVPMIYTETTIVRCVLHILHVCTSSHFLALHCLQIFVLYLEYVFLLSDLCCDDSRTVTPRKVAYGRQDSWTVQDIRHVPHISVHSQQPSFPTGALGRLRCTHPVQALL